MPAAAALVAVGIARLLVIKFAPEAAGSGIHRVEAVMAGEIEPERDMVLPVKFVGGLLSIGSGMALGREGPTVQMGSTIARLVASLIVREKNDEKVVLAAGPAPALRLPSMPRLGARSSSLRN